jgi:type IV secretion system coupling TraD/TrwB family protein
VTPRGGPANAGPPEPGAEHSTITILEGMQLRGAAPAGFSFDDEIVETNILFLGGIGAGKTNAMKHLIRQFRGRNRADDVFVFFDAKGDFHRDFYRPGDATISSTPDTDPGGVVWNIFRDLADDPRQRAEQALEIASTIFSDQLESAGQNTFFAAAARDIFAGVLELMAAGQSEVATPSNRDLRETLEGSADELRALFEGNEELAETDRYVEGLAGTARYLEGGGPQVQSFLAFLQLTLRSAFAGAFRQTGDFSVGDFVRRRGGRALFIEYDISVGSSLLPVYRVLMDMALKEALGFGRQRRRAGEKAPNFYFVLDEFALLPHLSHIGDGINFGRELGLRFLAATQNVNQLFRGYPGGAGESILSGFGTVLAFRLADEASRSLVRERYGANRKQISTYAPVRHEGVRQLVVSGNVIEDWHLSGLRKGQCIAMVPPRRGRDHEPPFLLQFTEFR